MHSVRLSSTGNGDQWVNKTSSGWK